MKITVTKGTNYSVLRKEMKAEIDRLASIERRKFITTDPGQSYVYNEKLREARAFLETDYSDTTDYPFLTAEATLKNIPPKGLAQNILAASAVSNRRLASVEMLRTQLKMEIDAAEDKISTIRGIVENSVFMTGGLLP